MKDFESALENFEKIVEILILDLTQVKELDYRSITKVQSYVRLYIRTSCVAIEGVAYSLIQVMLAEGSFFYKSLTIEERHILEGKMSKFCGRKKIPKKNYNSTARFIVFTFNLYMKYAKKGTLLDLTGKEYQSFRKLFDIRNKITHPKTAGDLEMDKEDMLVAEEAASWILAFKQI